MEASASDQLIRHVRVLSGLCPAPPPFVYFVYFVVKLPRRICRGAWLCGKKGIWYNVGRNEDVMGLVKTRRLMAMQKQQRAKATVVRQCAKFGTPSMKKGGSRNARPQQFCVNNIVK